MEAICEQLEKNKSLFWYVNQGEKFELLQILCLYHHHTYLVIIRYKFLHKRKLLLENIGICNLR